MSIQEIKKLADGTQLDLCGLTLVKTADGLYCSVNHHLYTWWNIEFNKMNERMQTEK